MIKAYRGMQESEFGQGVNFGVYADVLEVGKVNVGDRLELDSRGAPAGEPRGGRTTTTPSECDPALVKTNADGARG
jgi:MOSC domain-containing protein YiiM